MVVVVVIAERRERAANTPMARMRGPSFRLHLRPWPSKPDATDTSDNFECQAGQAADEPN